MLQLRVMQMAIASMTWSACLASAIPITIDIPKPLSRLSATAGITSPTVSSNIPRDCPHSLLVTGWLMELRASAFLRHTPHPYLETIESQSVNPTLTQIVDLAFTRVDNLQYLRLSPRRLESRTSVWNNYTMVPKVGSST